ncbi:THO complex subunit 1 transcription elongation factor [Nitzschia inconspicua]|uniref:THO complex subunit 1 transcription elongation factor n=1 Tax=Nitzschia inconspicua TaxID=303405 RepID=A0A9K3LC90_9STRA|nr:THO complex subunit 1 transcription elongation factor [Nitzschia inconspicua]
MSKLATSTAPSPTDEAYLSSIRDPFFKTLVAELIPPLSDSASSSALKPAQNRLDDLDIALRKQLFKMMMEQRQRNANDEEAARFIGIFWQSALDLCHHLVHFSSQPTISDVRYEGMNARRFPIVLLSDCLDGLPSLEASQRFWEDFVEPALGKVIFGDLFWNDAKTVCHLPFLKVCNQFMRALERSVEDTIEWKGRILWDLAKGFSVADKSSLKLWGSFHTNNETDYESHTEFEEQRYNTIAPTAIDAVSTSSSLDYTLYEAFWSLQRDFSNPNHIQVGDFIKKLRLVLTALESAASNKSSTTSMSSQDVLSTISKKYLTSSALLPSQIASPNFRCSVVSQFIILGWHLSAESPPLKNALASLLTKARKLLQSDNPELYELLWNGILSSGREDEWRRWKKQKCPAEPFEPIDKGKSTKDESSPKRKKSRLMDGPLGDSEGKNKTTEEAYEFLSFLDLKKISKEHMEKLPKLGKHLETYVEALDPESGIEEEYHPKNDSMYTWQAMRLYSRHQASLLRDVRRPDDLERITRLWYKSKGEEIPGDIPPESKLIDTGDEDDNANSNMEEKSPGGEDDVKEDDDSHTDANMENDEDEDDHDSVLDEVDSQGSQRQQSLVGDDKMDVDADVCIKVNSGETLSHDEVKDAILVTDKKEDNKEDGQATSSKNVKETGKEGNLDDAKVVDASKETSAGTTDQSTKKEEKVTNPSEQPVKPKQKENNKRKGGQDNPLSRNAPTQRDEGRPKLQSRDGGRRSNDAGGNRHGGRNDRIGHNEPPSQSRGRVGGRPDGMHEDDYRGGGSGSGGRQSGNRFGGGLDRGGNGAPSDRSGPPDRGSADRGGPRGGRGDGRRGGNESKPYRRRR